MRATGLFDDILRVSQGRVPGQLIIQYSDACNAGCPQCELRVQNKFRRAKIGMDDAKRIIDAAVRNGVRALSFTGGEPFLYKKDLFPLIRYATDAGIKYTRSGTNGYMFAGVDKPDWEKRVHHFAWNLALSGLYTFWISIDSADPNVHEQMRRLPGVIKGIEKAIPILQEYGIYPAANLGINRNTGGCWSDLVAGEGADMSLNRFYKIFRESFRMFYQRVIDLGFTITNSCYPMSVQTSGNDRLGVVYGASSSDHIVRFSKEEKARLFQALMDTIPTFRGKIRIFSPLCSLYSLTRYYRGMNDEGYACQGGINYFFVDAQNGNTYPCGFRVKDNLGKYWEMDMAELPCEATCRDCDWECFRDPSEMLGSFLELPQNPLSVFRRFIKDPTYLRLWWSDIRYYQACSLFHGPPDYRRLAKFQRRRPYPTPALTEPENAKAVQALQSV